MGETQLFAPTSWYDATADERAKYSNGCGPACWKFDIVPDNLLGVSVARACDVHDWMYEFGSTEADRREADDVFYRNMKILVRVAGGWMLWPRLFLARWYFRGVRGFGKGPFDAAHR